MISKIKRISFITIIVITMLSSLAFADKIVVVNNAGLYISSDHYSLLDYRGYMRIRTNIKVGEYVYTSGWIRYSIEGLKSAQKNATITGTELKEATLDFKDTLVLGYPKTKFSYNVDRRYVGGQTTAIPVGSQELSVQNEIVAETK